MISLADAAGIALVALGLVLTPGPNMLYLRCAVARHRRRSAVARRSRRRVRHLAGCGGRRAHRGPGPVPGANTAVRVLGALYLSSSCAADTNRRKGSGAPDAGAMRCVLARVGRFLQRRKAARRLCAVPLLTAGVGHSPASRGRSTRSGGRCCAPRTLRAPAVRGGRDRRHSCRAPGPSGGSRPWK